MSSITIHKLSSELDSKLRRLARSEKLSLNKMIQKILHQSLGLNEHDRKEDFVEFCGIWSEQDFDAFKKNTEDLNHLNPQDWQ